MAPTHYTEQDRLNLEVQKLEAELSGLRRPALLRPTSWISIASATAAVVGIGLQYANSHREYARAELKLEAARIETGKLELAKARLEEAVAALREEHAALLASVASAERQVERARQQLARAQPALADQLAPYQASLRDQKVLSSWPP